MQLPDPKTSANVHLVADWLELAAAGDPDGRALSETLVTARGEIAERRGYTITAVKTDSWRNEAASVWQLLRARAAVYGDLYPFQIATDTDLISVAPVDDGKLLYAFLLAASSLAAFDPTETGILTGGFERVSRHVLAAMLPPGSTVNVFGTAALAGERYDHNKLIDRLTALATDLNTSLSEEAEEAGASGDGGLDLVGWADFYGPLKRIPLFLGQCACGDEWMTHELRPAEWASYIQSTSYVVPVTFIPYAYRDDDNDWLSLFRVPRAVLIDRPRWLKLLQTAYTDLFDQAVSEVPRDFLLDHLPGLAGAVSVQA